MLVKVVNPCVKRNPGVICDRQAAGQALALPWATGEAERGPLYDQHSVGQASAPRGPVSDLQMAGQASELPRSTGSAVCWLSDSVTQARNKLFVYLNGQRVGSGNKE